MLTPAAYAVVTICASRSLRVISGSRYVGAVAGGRTDPAESKTRLPHGVRSQAFAASENRIICAALRFITSSLENASQSSFERIILHQRSSRRISRSRQLSIMQLSRLSFPAVCRNRSCAGSGATTISALLRVFPLIDRWVAVDAGFLPSTRRFKLRKRMELQAV